MRPAAHIYMSPARFQELCQVSDRDDLCWGYVDSLQRQPVHCWLRPEKDKRAVCAMPSNEVTGDLVEIRYLDTFGVLRATRHYIG
jgi:hypothetical protein